MKNKLMNILITIPFLLCCFSTCYAQTAPDILWIKTFGGDYMEYAHSVQQTTDGGYIVAGCTSSYGSGNFDVWIVKTDESGNEEWNQTYGGLDNDVAYDVRQTTDEGFIIVGYSDSFGPGYHNVYLIKTDNQGNEEWHRTFGNYDNRGNAVALTDDGGYIIAGATWLQGSNDYFDVWLIKTDASGFEEWNKTYGGYEWDEAKSVQKTADGGYIVCGYSNYNIYLLKTDTEGNKEWSHSYAGGSIDIGYSAQQTNDGGYIIIGYTYTADEDMQYWLIKTDEQGNEEWNKIYGGTEEDCPYDVIQTNDGGYIITGNTKPIPLSDLWIIKTDDQGNITWDKIYDDNGCELGNSIEQTTDGGYIVAGEKKNSGSSWSDFLLVRVDSDSIMSVNDDITDNNYLSSYPNPFSASTIINYSLPSNMREASIEIFNIKGQKIKIFPINNNHSAVKWNTEDLSSGIYFYKINIDNSPIKKMIKLK